MVNKKRITISLCIMSLFVMLIVFYNQNPSITGEQVIFKPVSNYDVGKNSNNQLSVNKGPVKSTNLFAQKTGFFRHTECDIDKNGVGVCVLRWGGGKNKCQTGLTGFYQCNHLECLEGACTRVAKEGSNKCSFEGRKC